MIHHLASNPPKGHNLNAEDERAKARNIIDWQPGNDENGEAVFTTPVINRNITLSSIDSKRSLLQLTNYSNIRLCLITWIVATHQPFSTVELWTFKRLLACSSNSTFDVPPRATVKRNINGMHEIAKQWLKTELVIFRILQICLEIS